MDGVARRDRRHASQHGSTGVKGKGGEQRQPQTLPGGPAYEGLREAPGRAVDGRRNERDEAPEPPAAQSVEQIRSRPRRRPQSTRQGHTLNREDSGEGAYEAGSGVQQHRHGDLGGDRSGGTHEQGG